MLHLLWALLNIGLFIFFIVICFNATKLIKERLGTLAAVVFVFGLLSFVSGSKKDNDNLEPNSNQVKTWKFNDPDSLKARSIIHMNIELEKNLVSTYSLGISYSQDKQLQNTPISANTLISGLVGGISWKPGNILVNRTANNKKFAYEVYGTNRWTLLGMTIYAQPKSWSGIATLP